MSNPIDKAQGILLNAAIIIVNRINPHKSPFPRWEFPLHLLERVRVRQGEGKIPLPLTPSRQGRENYNEF
jgi:hypothetical protein